jgi:CCR4-NOT transcription complex subunit 1
MEVYSKYFSRLVVGNAPQIFPGSLNRSVANPGNYQLLVNEVRKVSHDVEQAGKIAESIETATEDIFRDFDLSTFMEHFKLDALEKTILALAVKASTRSDLLRTKGELIRISSTTQLTATKPTPFYMQTMRRSFKYLPPRKILTMRILTPRSSRRS